MSKKLSIINTISVILVLVVNYYSQSGNINNQTVGGLSNQYDNLFTPAGYAFAIWGIIFLGLIAYVIYQLKTAFSGEKIETYEQTGYLFALVNFGNASWVIVWLHEFTGLTVLIMLLMLAGLLTIVVKTNMERWDAPFKIIVFVWWPICLYVGWISVATIANIAAYLSKYNWEGGVMSEAQWTMVMIIVTVIVNTFMIWNRSMREFALVGIWALLAIFVRHQDSSFTALSGAVFLLINVIVHGYQNRATNPFMKLFRAT